MKNILNKLFIASFLFANLAQAGVYTVDQLQAGGITAPTLTSTVATGTPPLTVTSTTPVPNLAVTNAVNVTGTVASAVTGTTQATNDSSTKIATTAFANPGASIAANGYEKLPGGLIIEYGQQATTGANPNNVIFPLAFPHGVLSIAASCLMGVSVLCYVSVDTQSASGASFVESAWYNFQWIAIGW